MKSRFITEQSLIDEVIRACDVCYIGMVDENEMPYTLPFNFGYENGKLLIHSGPGGHKLEVLRRNPNVCVVFSTAHEMYHQSENVACSYSMKYKSVVLKGKVEFIEEIEEKVLALSVVMKHYTQREDFRYSMPSLKNVNVMRIIPKSMECKYFGY
ncbi:MAG TPA: pyridoxamine 5'-phosphate oxidase family protein [Lentimicrobium sp.]|nr:pyridoxamine 5'-phosphate oxidase family protein [Lentimicrobium sp.]